MGDDITKNQIYNGIKGSGSVRPAVFYIKIK